MSPSRRLSHARVNGGGARRALAASDGFGNGYGMPNLARAPRRGVEQSASSGNSYLASAESGAASAAASPPPTGLNYEAYSDDDPNLEDDEAGGDSDIEGDEIDIHSGEALLRLQHNAEEASDLLAKSLEQGVICGDGVRYNRQDTDLKIHKVPEDWALKPYKQETPAFTEVDNPGDWDEMTYEPKYHPKTGAYLYHSLPTGVTPVPADPETGKRQLNGFNFRYDGKWQHNDAEFPTPFHPGANVDDARKSVLDAAKLQAHGVTNDTHHSPIVL